MSNVINESQNKDPIVGIRVTLDGEKLLRKNSVTGMEYVEEPEEKPLLPLPPKFQKKHHDAIAIIHSCIEQIRMMEGREVPLLRSEAIENGVDKRIIRELEGFALIKARVIQLVDVRTGSRTGRCLVYFTPQGNAYVREVLLRPGESNEAGE